MRRSQPVRHVTSSREAGECSTSWRARPGRPLWGDDDVMDAELFEFPIDAGLAVAAVGGGRLGHPAEPAADAADRGGRVVRRGPGGRS
jgi:hypothetical protein